MPVKLVKWAIFGVLLAILPFILLAGALWSQDKRYGPVLLWGHGELLLVCAAISADALGELIGSSKKNILRKLVCGGASVLLVILMSGWYMFLQSGNMPYNPAKIAYGSFALFVVTICCSLGCKALAEK